MVFSTVPLRVTVSWCVASSAVAVSGAGGMVSAPLIKDRTAVVGIGQTTFGKGLPDTELSLACQAVSMALDDAGIPPSEVDGIASYTMEPNREVDVARNVGLGDITFFTQVGYGGGAGCATVLQAAKDTISASYALAPGIVDSLKNFSAVSMYACYSSHSYYDRASRAPNKANLAVRALLSGVIRDQNNRSL